MSVEKVKAYFAGFGMEDRVLEFPVSSATVAEAAAALHCEPCHIAKTLAFLVCETPMVIVMAGDARIDNAKYKARFAKKAKMPTPDEVQPLSRTMLVRITIDRTIRIIITTSATIITTMLCRKNSMSLTVY